MKGSFYLKVIELQYIYLQDKIVYSLYWILDIIVGNTAHTRGNLARKTESAQRQNVSKSRISKGNEKKPK